MKNLSKFKHDITRSTFCEMKQVEKHEGFISSWNIAGEAVWDPWAVCSISMLYWL